MEHDPDDLITLRIYRLPSGSWAGRLLIGEDEFGVLRGAPSSQEVEKAAADVGIYPDRVEVEST